VVTVEHFLYLQMKQQAKMIRRLNFWIYPRSEESWSLLKRFNPRKKNTSPPRIAAAILIESKNIKPASEYQL
jgi:hypothetical protein